MRVVSGEERQLLAHIAEHGRDGYPIFKLGKRWAWGTDKIAGPPKVFQTKREAVASFELFLEMIR